MPHAIPAAKPFDEQTDAALPELLAANAMIDDQSVRRAAVAAGLCGLTGMGLLCWLFIDADYIVGLIDSARVMGLPLVLLLLLTVGGYAMLAFYGLRLRSAWASRNAPDARRRRHDPGRLALSDLRKIRWYSAATMVTLLFVFLAPSEWPMLSAHWDRSSHVLWRSPSAFRTFIMLWTVVAAAVVLAARRAAWDIAAAAGNLSGPDNFHAFDVLIAKAPATAATPDAGSIATAGSGTTPTRPPEREPVAAVPLDTIPVAQVSVAQIAVAPVAAAPIAPPRAGSRPADALKNVAAADTLQARRDWESVLMVVLILLLLLAVAFLDNGRGMRKSIGRPQAAQDAYDVYSQEQIPSGYPLVSAYQVNKSDLQPTRGLLAAGAVLAEQFLYVLSAACFLWVSMCLVSGPRWRRPAILLLTVYTALMLYDATATEFIGLSIRRHDLPGLLADLNSGYESAAISLIALVLLTRRSVGVLLEQSIRRPRKRRPSA